MILKNLRFKGFVFGQSGVQGFFGEGDEYPHHKWYKLLFGWFGFSFAGMVFVAKTITLRPRIYPESSNTELRDGYKIKRMFPHSVWCTFISFIWGYLLNAIGLANPGALTMMGYKKWQKRTEPFQLSVMLMEKTIEEQLIEAQSLCRVIKYDMPANIPYAIQYNDSCPNTGHDNKQDPTNSIRIFEVFRRELPGVLLIPKYDLLIEPETIVALKPYCDAFCIGNTIAFGKKPEKIEWNKLFKNGISPLLKYFGGKFAGGLSGKPLFPLLTEWLEKMEAVDPSVVIIAGGGIMKKEDILHLSQFKIVRGVALGSVAILRPWRLQGLIKYGNKIFSNR